MSTTLAQFFLRKENKHSTTVEIISQRGSLKNNDGELDMIDFHTPPIKSLGYSFHNLMIKVASI